MKRLIKGYGGFVVAAVAVIVLVVYVVRSKPANAGASASAEPTVIALTDQELGNIPELLKEYSEKQRAFADASSRLYGAMDLLGSQKGLDKAKWEWGVSASGRPQFVKKEAAQQVPAKP